MFFKLMEKLNKSSRGTKELSFAYSPNDIVKVQILTLENKSRIMN